MRISECGIEDCRIFGIKAQNYWFNGIYTFRLLFIPHSEIRIPHSHEPPALSDCAAVLGTADDPSAELTKVMTRLEERFNWRPRTDWRLAKRILHYADGLLAMKEIEYIGRQQSGTIPERV